jgi:D-alanyl-D-alanine carboxypeptidase
METRMKRVRTAAVCLVAIATLIAPGAAAASRSRADPLRQDLRALIAHGAPGAILVVRHGDTTKRFAAGYADRARKRAMRASDHFKIASLTKSYTATVVLQLVDAGTLHLTDTVERWLPGLVPNGDRITLRELLNHTSGIPDYENDPRFLKPYLDGNLGYYWAPRELVRLAVSHKPLFAPGQTRISSYSNTNYVIAGLIVEAATGRQIGDELRRRIFQPLRLRHTLYATRPGLPRPYAHGYMVLDQPRVSDVTALSPSLSPASGAIVSTADDVDFYRALFTGRLLPPALLGQMRTTISEGSKVDIPGQRYGLGLERFPTPCGAAWGHNGVIPGYLTFAFTSKDGDRQALLMVNEDAQSLPKPAAKRFFPVLDRAYCRTR